MTQEVKATKESLNRQADSLIDFAQDNLGQLSDLCSLKDDTQDFYLGLMRRHCIFNMDLVSLLNANNLSRMSMLILCRCIIDDYIRLIFIKDDDNPVETIVKLNGDAYRNNISKLERLAEINEKLFDNKHSYYLTKETLNEVKSIFKSKEQNEKYFQNIETFKLKSFPTTRAIIDALPMNENGHSLTRAFFLWGHLSDFIHYSTLSYEYEIDTNSMQTDLNYIQECIFYSYKIVLLSFDFFEKRNNLNVIDRHNLKHFYSNAETN